MISTTPVGLPGRSIALASSDRIAPHGWEAQAASWAMGLAVVSPTTRRKSVSLHASLPSPVWNVASTRISQSPSRGGAKSIRRVGCGLELAIGSGVRARSSVWLRVDIKADQANIASSEHLHRRCRPYVNRLEWDRVEIPAPGIGCLHVAPPGPTDPSAMGDRVARAHAQGSPGAAE